MKYHIYPPIAIARIGNSDSEFFIGPETPGSTGSELTAAGEQPVTRYKDSSFRIKRQAARFRLYQTAEDGSVPLPADLPAGARLVWSVSVANTKDAVVRSGNPPEEGSGPVPQPIPDPQRANRAVKAAGSIAPGGNPVPLVGTYLAQTAHATSVQLGELRVDADGSLLFLPGFGISRSPEGKAIGSEVGGGGYYNNLGWFDDVCDGRIQATVIMEDGTEVKAESAWIITGPPDFAPGTECVVTLYDVLFQTAVNGGFATVPQQPSFSRDIWPILRRAAGLRWVNGGSGGGNPWASFSTDWTALAQTSVAAQPARRKQAELLAEIEGSSLLENFSLRPWQRTVIRLWTEGNFINDYTGAIPGEGLLSPEGLTRTCLDASVGQGFFPGIEAGLLVTDKSHFQAAFRVSDRTVPGSFTALMALPWQADFLKCNGNWWPSQRPDDAPQAPTGTARRPWIRPIASHRDLVNHFGKLGIIVPRTHGGQQIRVEEDRDPAF